MLDWEALKKSDGYVCCRSIIGEVELHGASTLDPDSLKH